MYNKVICLPIIDQFIVGTWGDWGPFSPCSEPCGPGTKDRYRECKDVDGIVRDDCDESVVGEMGTEVCEDKMCGKLKNCLL